MLSWIEDNHIEIIIFFVCVVAVQVSRDTIRYDSVYLTCSIKKLTCSQFSPPHGTNKKLKCETTLFSKKTCDHTFDDKLK